MIIPLLSPVGDSVPGPVGESVPGPVGESVPGPVGDSAPGPVGDSVPGPVGESVPGPVGESLPGPVGDSVPGPVGDYVPGTVGDYVPGPIDDQTVQEISAAPAPLSVGAHASDQTSDHLPSAKLVKVDVVDECLISRHCVVSYDNIPFPGKIVDVDDDEEVEVSVMHKIGRNRYFWPAREDRLWYPKEMIVTLLPDAPGQVTKRHSEIDPHIWALIEIDMDLV
ncbi:small proline-rich protein 3-like [Pecten maximus]|uniref:small proline-rich protein 3-like n=1 Tax=Pecten maximus TaxID=6579 RepID=UPI0014581AB3|nr:small proline-rich protein 3-like [Pecten maximus]